VTMPSQGHKSSILGRSQPVDWPHASCCQAHAICKPKRIIYNGESPRLRGLETQLGTQTQAQTQTQTQTQNRKTISTAPFAVLANEVPVAASSSWVPEGESFEVLTQGGG